MSESALHTRAARRAAALARGAMEASAWDKMREFADLGYPRRVLRMACNYLGATTRERAWFEVRDGM